MKGGELAIWVCGWWQLQVLRPCDCEEMDEKIKRWRNRFGLVRVRLRGQCGVMEGPVHVEILLSTELWAKVSHDNVISVKDVERLCRLGEMESKMVAVVQMVMVMEVRI